MWTPRRIFMALAGLLVYSTAYFAYSTVLGSLDGLPPLPEQYLKADQETYVPPTPLPSSLLDRKFEMAFGTGCAELRYPIKLEMKQRGLLLASYKFEIIKSGPREGWVEMTPLSLAAVSDKKGTDGLPEINTVYADVAYIRFDKPIRSMGDFNDRKMASAELHADPEARLPDPRKGRIRLSNNRRTLDLNDDVEMVTPGPVYYEAEPRAGQPHIYTFTAVQVVDHQNTGLAVPDRTVPREPTVAGVGLQVYLIREAKEPPPPKPGERPRPRKKDDRAAISGVQSVGLDHSVEMNLWTDGNSSFVAPGAGPKNGKAPAPVAKKEAPAAPVDKRLLTVKTNGPFRYDLVKELAHFEKPPVPKPGLVEHVTVTRAGRTTGVDLLDCEYLDIQLQRKNETSPKKDGPPIAKKTEAGTGTGDLEVKTIRAWGETVVMTSDSDNLHATGVELLHDADAHMTILKGGPDQQVQAVKQGNLLRGSEMHLFGDGKEITQAHVLGDGFIGMGDLNSQTGEYSKQAYWNDRLVYTKQMEMGLPPQDVFTLVGKSGQRAVLREIGPDKVQQFESDQIKIWLKPAEPEKKDAPKAIPPKPAAGRKPGPRKKGDEESMQSARITRLEGTGNVRSDSPDLVIKHADYLNVLFKDVPKLIRPKSEPKSDPKAAKAGPAPTTPPKDGPRVGTQLPTPREAGAEKKDAPPQAPALPAVGPDGKPFPPKAAAPKPKIPFVVKARSIEAWVNRDPEGQNELDHVHAIGDVEGHQDPETPEKQGTDIAGQTVDIQAYPEGDRLVVLGEPAADPKQHKWGVVRSDTLTVFGFDIVIDQRTDTSVVKGEGSMELLSTADMEGKKLEKPTTMTVLWKHKMDFLGADRLIYYHGGVQAYQENSRLRCEWMQVLLDRPVYLDRERQKNAPKPPPPPGVAEDDGHAKVDTVMCFHSPKDDDIPRPKMPQPVTAVEETRVDGRLVKFQSIQAPDLVMVNTPLDNKRARHDVTATSSDLFPGTVRIWQAGQKDDATANATDAKKDTPAKKDAPPRKKGELGADEEMKLTIVQFGEKMKAEDLRKRAKFWTNVRVVHLPADRPNIPVDLREGDIPRGAVYMEARDTLDVFSTVQRENDADGKPVEVPYQEMIAMGNVRVRKQGEFFGDADRVTYSELKGTITFYGTERNPAVLNQVRGQGIRDKTHSGRTIIYHVRTKQVETIGATQITE